MLEFYFPVLLNMLEFYFQVLLNMLALLLMHVIIFLILGQPWLASIRSSQRGGLETATGGSLLPRAAPLLLPHVMRWETLAPATLFLLLHPMTPLWRCGRCLLLRHA
jgi:hypothetical protein